MVEFLMLKWHIGALICPIFLSLLTQMLDYIITDQVTDRQVEITFDEYCDIQLGLKCAADVYTEAGNSKRANEFKSLSNLLT